MRRQFAVLAGVALSLSIAGTAMAASWQMPLAYPATNFQSENDAQFATCVGSATKNAITIVTHPDGSLFAGNDIMRAIQTNQAPIGERLISAQANQNVLYGIDSIPFLATSFAASDRLWAAALPAMKKALARQNLVYIYAVPWPPQGLYVKKPVSSLADLKGVKFRAYNTATARIAALAGMVPVQIEAADLSQALATGVVDAFMSSGTTGVDSKVWESLNYFYNLQAWLPRNIVFANKQSFNHLDKATQSAIMKCGAAAAARGTKTAEKLSGQYLKTLASHGMHVGPAGAELDGQLKAIGKTMTKDWLAKAGPEGKTIIAAYQASK